MFPAGNVGIGPLPNPDWEAVNQQFLPPPPDVPL